jgi:hypothetical protein
MMIRLGNCSLPICTGVKSGCDRAVKISFSIEIQLFGSLSRHLPPAYTSASISVLDDH